MNTEIIKKYYENIIDWNAITGNSISNEDLRKVYTNLVDEETEETLTGLRDKDQVEFIDGVIDSLVVGSYLFALKQQADFTDYTLRDLSVVELSEAINTVEQIKSNGTIFKNIDKILSIYEDVFYTIKDSVNVFGAFQEVLDSNWSKFPDTNLVNPEEEVSLIESQGRYKGVVFSIVNTSDNLKKYVFRDENGKILKPSTFKEPQLAQFIQKKFL
jgi:hypothetical protein